MISPASYPRQDVIEFGIRRMREHGLRVKAGKYLFCPMGSKEQHASVEQRKEDFVNAWNDPEVDLILCTRGGSGTEDLIQVLDWEQMRSRPELKLIGFSNITCLTGAMLRKGCGHPFAGPNLGRLVSLAPESLESFRRGMAEEAQEPFPLVPIRPGNCEGGIYAGHLTLLAKLDSMPEFRVNPAGRIVFIECVRGTPETLEAEWNKLLKSGFFKEVRGVVFGHFSRIGTPEMVNATLQKFADTLTCPVYRGFPYGHENTNHTSDFFAKAEIRDNVLYVIPRNAAKPASGQKILVNANGVK